MPREFPPVVVSTFGGGLNIDGHPARIRDDQWTFCNGFIPLAGAAEQLPTLTPLGSAIGTASDSIIGFAQDAFTDTHLLVATANLGTLRLWKLSVVGGLVEITRLGGTNDPRADTFDVLSTAFLNGLQLFAGGMQDTLSNRSSLVSYTGGATYATIDPPAGEELRPQQIVSFGAHVIAGGVFRVAGGLDYDTETKLLAWSAVNDPTIWAQSLENGAADVTLDDVTGPIVRLVPISGQFVAVFTRDQIHLLRPTERIPAFRRDSLMPMVGAGFPTDVGTTNRTRFGLAGATPFGAIFVAPDNVYLLSPNLQAIGTPIRGYMYADTSAVSFDITEVPQPIIWHPRWQQVLIPRAQASNAEKIILTFNPVDQAWGRFDLDSVLPSVISTNRVGVVRFEGPHRFVTHDDRQVYAEVFTSTVGFPSSFVDTKDFSFDDEASHLARIVVDMEGSSGATVTVSAWSRDEMNPTAWVALSGQFDHVIPPAFTVLGTVSATSPELYIRPPAAKWHRLRFTPAAGHRVRIRGFKLAAQSAGDR